MRIRSLRFKLVCIYGITVALLVVGIGVTLYFIIQRHLYGMLDYGLLSDAKIFLSLVRVENDSLKIPSDGLSARLDSIVRDIQPFAIVTDLQGNISYKNAYSPYLQALLREGKLDKILHQRSGSGKAVASDGTVFRFVSLEATLGNDERPSVIHVARSTHRLQAVLRSYGLFYVYSVPFVVGISMVVGWIITTRALKPFKDIAEAAQQITSRSLDTQIVSRHEEEEVKALVRSFNAMVDRLNRSFQQMRRFNSDAAHELRTPLSILRGETELLLRSPDLSLEELKAALSSNLEEIDKLTRIINDMLTLAEAEAGEKVIVKEPIQLRIFLMDLAEQVRALARAHRVELVLGEIPDIQIEGDRLLMQRAVLNVLDNAIKYSKDGGRVEIGASSDGSVARIQIQDYGIGILLEEMPYIFDRLFRGNSARSCNSKGSGLGLAITKWIIEEHRGKIQVASSPDQGTRFEIEMPLKLLPS